MKKSNRAESTNALLELIISNEKDETAETWIGLDGSGRIKGTKGNFCVDRISVGLRLLNAPGILSQRAQRNMEELRRTSPGAGSLNFNE